MPELRIDPITGRRVIIAPQRLDRPNAIRLQPWPEDDPSECPFCLGREAETPTELARYVSDDSGLPWSVRVVPNRYPALADNAILSTTDASCAARGRQEVLIESPHHVGSFTQLDATTAGLAVRAYRDRLGTCQDDPLAACGLVFKNYGPQAGASQRHIHSQFVSLAEVPPVLQSELAGFRQYHDTHGCCPLCQLITENDERYVIIANDDWLAFNPAASRVPYEICLVPKRHESQFERLDDAACDRLATQLQDVLHRLEKSLPYVAYNFWIHTAAFDGYRHDDYHWHMEITPRLIIPAGFEWGSGCWINPVPPEQAAEQLRSIEGHRVY